MGDAKENRKGDYSTMLRAIAVKAERRTKKSGRGEKVSVCQGGFFRGDIDKIYFPVVEIIMNMY